MLEHRDADRTDKGPDALLAGTCAPQATTRDQDFSVDAILRFRRFCVFPRARELTADGKPIDIGSRAFDLLVVLLQSRGQIVSKADILKHVWPTTIVEESNLRFQMTSLRTALGPDRDVIKTIPGRGYVFVADCHVDPTPRGAVAALSRVEATDLAHVSLASPSSSATVAVIDDDLGVREALEGLLLSAGMRAECFASVQEYRDRDWREPPACLILDVWLPGISGIDFNDELVREGQHPPVIFISGHADVHTSVRAMKAGAVEFLTKPVRHQELLDAVHGVIGH